jgi:hypothetical protein
MAIPLAKRSNIYYPFILWIAISNKIAKFLRKGT